MKNLLTLACVLGTVGTLSADWIAQAMELVKANTYDQFLLEDIVKRHLEADEQEILRLEKKAEANDEDGFFATMRACGYQAQWVAAQSSHAYHTKVRDFVKELPHNKADREWLSAQLRTLVSLEKELVELSASYDAATGVYASCKAGSALAAKRLHAEAVRKCIQSQFML